MSTTTHKVRSESRSVKLPYLPWLECVDPKYAVACVENGCGWIYDQRNGACPKCGSKAALHVWKSLNGRSAA